MDGAREARGKPPFHGLGCRTPRFAKVDIRVCRLILQPELLIRWFHLAFPIMAATGTGRVPPSPYRSRQRLLRVGDHRPHDLKL